MRSISAINLACGDFPKRCDDCLRTFDASAIRREFPILHSQMNGRPLVYLDNGASTQKPRVVIDRLVRYYQSEHANVHRGVYQLSQTATAEYEAAREKVRSFINAPSTREVIFTRGTTDSINLVASSFGRTFLKPGDDILISAMEHHSNIVPWQLVAQQTGATVRVIPINDQGELLIDEFVRMLSPRVKLVAVSHLSNVLGTINPVERITAIAHEHGAKVLVDGAQWVGHFPTDVQEIGCDFYAFSGHKMFAPTGIGILFGRAELLEAMPPYQGGGDMIDTVAFEKTTYADLPYKFEAGTPNIADAIGLGTTIDFLRRIGFENMVYYEHGLLRYAESRLRQVPGLRLIGTANNKSSVVSFVMEDPPVATIDIGAHLDKAGIAIRTGHHCCMPLMKRMGVESTARASLAFYNTPADIDRLAESLLELQAKEKRRAMATVASATSAGLHWPEPFADSPQAAADEMADDLALFDGWEERDGFILELGEKLPPMPPELKVEECRVHGCMSTVHMVGRQRPGTPDALDILADSDAHLVRGLIGLLQHVYSGQSTDSILAFDFDSFLRRVGLDKHLSMGRRSGLEGMTKRIRLMAHTLKQTGRLPAEFAAA